MRLLRFCLGVMALIYFPWLMLLSCVRYGDSLREAFSNVCEFYRDVFFGVIA